SPLVNLAYRFCQDRGRAEDMAQEAFIRAFRGLSKWRREGAFSTWLFALATNLYRTETRRIPPPPVPLARAPQPPPTHRKTTRPPSVSASPGEPGLSVLPGWRPGRRHGPGSVHQGVPRALEVATRGSIFDVAVRPGNEPVPDGNPPDSTAASAARPGRRASRQ